jgi:hypothetical protein
MKASRFSEAQKAFILGLSSIGIARGTSVLQNTGYEVNNLIGEPYHHMAPQS